MDAEAVRVDNHGRLLEFALRCAVVCCTLTLHGFCGVPPVFVAVLLFVSLGGRPLTGVRRSQVEHMFF